MKEDVIGRLVFGLTWGLVAVAWLGKYFHSKHT